MNLLPFGKLAAHRPRSFVPQNADLGDWPQIAPLFDQLERRAAAANSAAALEHWLLDWSELNAALDEEASRRYITMTCHTDNADAEKAYLHFVENVEPQLKPRQFALEQIYVAHPAREQLPKQRFQVFDRDVKNHVALFRPENVALETGEARLSQQYQKLIGAQTVNFRGEERTLVQMGRYLEEPSRALRQEAWELVANAVCRTRTNARKFLTNSSNCGRRSRRTRALKIIATTRIAKNAGSITRRKIVFNFTTRWKKKSFPPSAKSRTNANGS